MIRSAQLLTLTSLVLLFIGLMPASSRAQALPDWELILDRPSPDFEAVEFVSDSEGWLVAGGGLLYTTDGGATWTEAAPLFGGIDIDFADAQHGWFVGYDGTIYATTDGGAAWTEQTSGTNVHLRDVFAISAQEAWAVGSGEGFSDAIFYPLPTALLHTTDGGATWRHTDLPPNTWFNEITFVGQNGWALGVQSCANVQPEDLDPRMQGCSRVSIGGAMLRTTDGGQTWSLDDANAVTNDMVFVDETHGWMLACRTLLCEDAVLQTTDGGLTGQEQLKLPGGESFLAMTFRDKLHGWALAQDCPARQCPHTLYRTTDGGANWSSSPIDVGEGYYFSLLATNGDVYLTGSGTALRSTDDGASWQKMEHPALDITEMDFVDRKVGFAIDNDDLRRTDDAGRTWDIVGPVPDGGRLIEFLNAQQGFVVADDCCPRRLSISRTQDGGLTWTEVYSQGGVDCCFMVDFQFIDADHGWLVAQQAIIISADGGATWQRHAFNGPGTNISDADLVSPDEAWAIADGAVFGETHNNLLHSLDGGKTWAIVPGRSDEHLQQIEFVDPDHGWYTSCCPPYRFFATEDGGATWQPRTSIQKYFVDLVFADGLTAWRNTGHEILYTADGGRTWNNQLAGDLSRATLEFIDSQTGWLVLPAGRPGGLPGVPKRLSLYHIPAGGEGPTVPLVQPPGAGLAEQTSTPWVPWVGVALAVGGAVLALAMLARRSRRRS